MPPHKINVVSYSIKVGNSHFFAFISRLLMLRAMPLPAVYCKHCASCEFIIIILLSFVCGKVSFVNSSRFQLSFDVFSCL